MKTAARCSSLVFWGIFLPLFLFPPFADATEQQGASIQEREKIQVQDQYVPSSCKEVGVIQKMDGEGILVIVHPTASKAYSGKSGDPVHEKDVLLTFGGVYGRILFKDGNMMILGPDTQVFIEEVSQSRLKKEKRAVFRQTLGKVLFRAIPSFSYPNMTVLLESPLARVHVKGTEFVSGLIGKMDLQAESESGEGEGEGEQAAGEQAAGDASDSMGIDFQFPSTQLIFEDLFDDISSPPPSGGLPIGVELVVGMSDHIIRRLRQFDWEKRKKEEGLTWYESSFMHEVAVVKGEVDVTSKKDGETKKVKEERRIRVDQNGLGEEEGIEYLLFEEIPSVMTKGSLTPGPGDETGKPVHLEDPGTRGELDEIRQDTIDPHMEDHEQDPGHAHPTKPPCKHP